MDALADQKAGFLYLLLLNLAIQTDPKCRFKNPYARITHSFILLLLLIVKDARNRILHVYIDSFIIYEFIV